MQETSMRPLPADKTHGIIHTVTAKPEELGKIADALGIKGKDRDRMLRPGTIHIIREAKDPTEIREK
jgi:hypothetical protein